MKKLLALFLAVAMVFAFAACGQSAPDTNDETAEPVVKDTAEETAAEDTEEAAQSAGPVTTELSFGAPGPIGTYLYGNNASTMDQLIFLVFDPIIYTDPITNEFVSDVVDYEYVDDYTLALTVKEGVKFTNGEALTGEDILFTVSSETDAERASRNASMFTIFDFDKSYVSDDGMTAYLITDEIEATALSNLNVPVLCKSWVEENGWEGEAWYYEPNGTGPYYVDENVTGVYSVVKMKDEVKDGTYWNQDFSSDFETVKGTHYDDKSVMFIDVENGDIDMAFQIDSVDMNRIENEGIENVSAVLLPYNDVQNLVFDIDDGATQDENLRAAIAYGVNWADVALAAWEDYGKPATSVLASTMGEMYSNVGGYEYDPELAQEYADKVTGSKEVEILIFTDNLYVQECEVIRAYLEQIGITVKAEPTDMATFFANTTAGAGDIDFERYPNGNPASEPYLALKAFERAGTSPNQNMGSDEVLADMLEEARHIIDRSERAEVYAEIQQYMKDHFYAVPIAEVYGAYVYNNEKIAGADIISVNAANVRYVYAVQK